MEEQEPFDANWNDIDLSTEPSDEVLKKKLLEKFGQMAFDQIVIQVLIM